MSSHISVKGSLYAQDTEDGKTTDNIPFEIYSDYSVDDPATYFRQLHFSNVYSGSTFLGISNVGTYFYMSAPSTGAMTEQSNTFIVTSGGNVGIGKTDPSDRLHVEGNALVRGSSANVASASVSDNIYASNVMMGDGNLVVDGNANHRIPSGTIALWEDSTPSTIPDGWVLFNALGTRFIRGSTSTGAFGGANTANITISNVESHSHTASTAKFINNGHSHSIDVNIQNARAIHHHNLSTNTFSNSGGHNHKIGDIDDDFTYATARYWFLAFYPQRTAYKNAPIDRNLPGVVNHSHTYNYPSGNLNQINASHTHTSTTNIPTIGAGPIVHDVISDEKTDEQGTDISGQSIIPLFKSYVFIIKL